MSETKKFDNETERSAYYSGIRAAEQLLQYLKEEYHARLSDKL